MRAEIGGGVCQNHAMTDDWRAINLANWESRVPMHTGPDGYDLASFDDPAYLSPVVRYDLPRLGRLDGRDVVHLQCHIGTDTVSLARLGAKSVTGLDFSPSAVAAGRALAARTGADVAFVEADLHDAVDALGPGCADVVYTGIGALCWLPDVRRWAGIVATLLRPGGRLFIREGHPVLWAMSDPRPDGLLVIEYPYFETAGTVFVEHDSYAGSGTVESPESVVFNHGLGEIFSALLDAGLVITAFEEHRELAWNYFGEAMSPSPDFEGEFILTSGGERMPMTYTLQAFKIDSQK
ncbi:methyltransferase [Mycobacterium antarcticum]|nr:methyltransferase [Mycolicibacterium sp. TUM20983]